MEFERKAFWVMMGSYDDFTHRSKPNHGVFASGLLSASQKIYPRVRKNDTKTFVSVMLDTYKVCKFPNHNNQ